MWDVNARIIFTFTYQTTFETACKYTIIIYSKFIRLINLYVSNFVLPIPLKTKIASVYGQ